MFILRSRPDVKLNFYDLYFSAIFAAYHLARDYLHDEAKISLLVNLIPENMKALVAVLSEMQDSFDKGTYNLTNAPKTDYFLIRNLY
jgi:hypothetical protein